MKILRAKKSRLNRVEILLDDGQIVTVAYEIFLKNGIKLNNEISDELFSQLLFEDIYYKVKQSALGFIARRLHSKNELRIKLIKRKYPLQIIESVLNELENRKYLNDVDFAKIFIEERIKAKNWGKNKVKSELIKRGVASEVISDVIAEKFTSESEVESGLELARNKLKKLLNQKIDEKKVRTKLYSFLSSRGYDYDSCKQILGKLFDNIELSDF